MMVCGGCGSGISAQEKHKKLADGSVVRYVYYGCTRGKDINCKERYIEEKELVSQLNFIIDKIDLDESGIGEYFNKEFARYQKSNEVITGRLDEKIDVDINVKKYIKYSLENGTIYEKRAMLSCIRSKLVLLDKIITVRN